MKRITLTFDNGPHEVGTPIVLDALARRGLRATFFIVGERLLQESKRELAASIKEHGHVLANHTLTHSIALGRTTGEDVIRREIGAAQELLKPYGAANLFRPNGEKGKLGPHLLSEEAVEYLTDNDYTAVSWNCVPQDWVGAPGDWLERADAIMSAQDWSVVVLHDHCLANQPASLARFLDRAIQDGLEFRMDFPRDVVLVDRGLRAEALAGQYTPRTGP